MAIVPRASFPRLAVPRGDDDTMFHAARNRAISQPARHSSLHRRSNMFLLPQVRRGRDHRALLPPHVASYLLSRVATVAALFFTVLVLSPSPCSAGSAFEGANVEQPRYEVRGEQLGVPLPVVADVEVFKPRSYVEPRDVPRDAKKNRTAEGDVDGGSGFPLLVFLHGFCLPDAAQQEYSFTALRANAGGGSLPRQQTLSQVGLRRGGEFTRIPSATTTHHFFLHEPLNCFIPTSVHV